MLGISHEHLFDKIGVARQEDTFWTDPEARKGAVLARGAENELKRTGTELANSPPIIVPLGPGGRRD